MKAYGYARVSTHAQDLEPQIEMIIKYADLRKIELVNIFQDKASGKDLNRSDFQRMVKTLVMNPLGVQAIIITKLDRIGRSLPNLIDITNYLQEKSIGLISITNSIDTTTKEGRLFFYIMGALGEYERELIMERTQAGRQRAIEEGKKMGQPEKQIPMDEVKRMIADGVPKTVIAKKFKVHRSTIIKRLKEDKGK